MSRRWTVAIVVGITVLVGWWVWPTVRPHDDLDVLVVADDTVAAGERPAELRIREDGRSMTWTELEPGDCEDVTELVRRVDDADPDRVVVWSAVPEACLVHIATALQDRQPVVVASAPADDLGATGAVIVDPSRLVGDPVAGLRLPCEWWERCDLDGFITIRDETGGLDDEGYERIARMVVASL